MYLSATNYVEVVTNTLLNTGTKNDVEIMYVSHNLLKLDLFQIFLSLLQFLHYPTFPH